MSDKVMVDEEPLREQVRVKYREVATVPNRAYHFHTGRPLAARLGYDTAVMVIRDNGYIRSLENLVFTSRFILLFSSVLGAAFGLINLALISWKGSGLNR